ncbi:MAG TPA: branched-chain amino acid ABC transporter permease, partial [Pseudolabrys sp.]|nr:branched-chain amino acid ABC transporter permease [Pseudolabrys sp.]
MKSSSLARWVPEIIVAIALVVLPFAFGETGLDLLTRILLWGLFGLGFSLLFGFAGLLSFGQAAFYGTGGFVTAYLLTGNVIGNVWLGIVSGVVTAGVFSLLVGYLALRRVGIYFAMITLAFGELSYFLENSPLSAFTGGENGLPGIPAPSLQVGSFHYAFTGGWPSYELIAALFFVGYLLARFIIQSPVGSVLIGINQNPTRTAALGHNVPGYKLAVFVLAAAYAGLAGAVRADHRIERAGRHLEGDVGIGVDAAVALAHRLHVERELAVLGRMDRLQQFDHFGRRQPRALGGGGAHQAARPITQPQGVKLAADPAAQERHQQHEGEAEDELPQVADHWQLLQAVAQREPNGRTDGRA